MNNEEIKSLMTELEPYMVEMRRTLHTYAETGGNEWDTRKLIEAQLDSEQIPYIELEGTGVVGILDTGKPGPHIALRADIDALPMSEDPENIAGPRLCRSRTPDQTGHMCGHDAHTAMLLGSMKTISKNRDQLTGTFYFCFEQGEENNTGWKAMIAELKKYPITVCWGMHVVPQLPTGMFNVEAGPRLAGNQFIDFTIIGRGGHGSRPDQSINPVFCGANIYNNLAVAFANQIDANQTVTLGLTAINGGTVANVIPDTANVLGTLRFFDMEEGKKAVQILHDVAEHTAAMHNCTIDWTNMAELGAVTYNDPHYSDLAYQGMVEVFGQQNLYPIPPQYGSESFSRYGMVAPSVFGLLGVGNPEKGAGAGAHTTKFDVDEDALKYGMMATLKFVSLVLNEQ